MSKNRADTLFTLSLKKLAFVTVVLPLVSMLFCFVTSMIFNFQLVNTTICDMRANIMFLVQMGIAEYGNRLENSFKNRTSVQKTTEHKVWRWVSASVGVYVICCTVHEKIFITFMVASISYMLSTCVLSHMSQSSSPTYLEKLSYRTKLSLCVIIALTSLGMMYFFYKHRVYCEELAFSWFALCEYVICFANMAFHATIIWDMPDEQMVICLPHSQNSPNCHILTTKKNE